MYELAKKIAEVENADIRIVSLAALLHDVDDAKISPDTYKDKVNAVAFLKKEDVSDNEIGRIVVASVFRKQLLKTVSGNVEMSFN